jgi:hypothetical protein
MSDDKRAKRTRILLILFIILLPAALWLGREFLTGGLIMGMRAVDAADMAILTPIYIIILLFLWNYMEKHDAPRWLVVTFLVFAFIFLYGQAMHATGNAINTFATEVNDYKDQMPKDLYDLIFFLDERLSHLVLFVAVTGLIGCWFVWDQLALAPPLMPRLPLILIPMGLLYGMTKAYAVIEARMVWIIFPIVVVLMGMWLWYWRRSRRSLIKYAGHRPFTTFVAVMVFVAIAGMVFWWLYWGGFPQPSEVGL